MDNPCQQNSPSRPPIARLGLAPVRPANLAQFLDGILGRRAHRHEVAVRTGHGAFESRIRIWRLPALVGHVGVEYEPAVVAACLPRRHGFTEPSASRAMLTGQPSLCSFLGEL